MTPRSPSLPVLSLLSILVASAPAAALSGCQSEVDLGAPADVPAPDGGDAAPSGPLGLRAFVTSASFTGDLVSAAGGGTDGLAAGDALCATAAKGAGLSGQWIAYLSSGADAAKDHVVDDGAFYAVDGTTKLFENKLAVGARAEVEIPDEKGGRPTDIMTGVDKFGDPAASSGPATFWTGSTASGEVADTCASWTSPDLSVEGSYGYYLEGSSGSSACYHERHLLCLEQRAKHAGRPTKRVFVTRSSFRGSFATGGLTGIAGADSLCAAAASDGGLKGTFVAWLSGMKDGALVRASDRLDEARYVMLDGTPAFESKSQLTAGPSAPIMVTELGTPLANIPPLLAWTGTLASGTPDPDHRCLDWSSDSTNELGVAGDVAAGGDRWTASPTTTNYECNDMHHLYCFEK